MSKNTYFISGHLDLTTEQWTQHYKSKIDSAIGENAHFVVSDSRGADQMSLIYLSSLGIPRTRVIIFHQGKKPRFNPDKCFFATLGGFKDELERDKAMTLNSDADIAWINQDTKIRSGTQKNIDRRKEFNQF